MKFSMKKDSPFRNNIFPWLIYGFGTGFYISLLLVKMIKRPELLSPWITILLAAAGIALGAVYMMYLKKKVTNRRPYLSLKQGMIIVCQPFCATVPAIIIIRSILIVFSIRLIMLAIIGHKIFQCKSSVSCNTIINTFQIPSFSPVGGSSPGRPGWAGPVRRIGDPGAVSVSGGVGPADGTGRRGVPGYGSSGPAAGVQPGRRQGLSPGSYGQLSRGGPHRGPAVSPGRHLPAGGLPPAAVFQQLRPGVYPGGGGAGLLRQPPGRGAAVGGAYSGGAGHSPGPAPAGGGTVGTSRLCPGPSPPCPGPDRRRAGRRRDHGVHLRLRGVLSGAAAGNGPGHGFEPPGAVGSGGADPGDPGPAPYPPGLRVGGGPAGLGRPVGPRAVRRRAVRHGPAHGAVSGGQGRPRRRVRPAGLAGEHVPVKKERTWRCVL